MKQTKGAIGNLLNRYKAVLKKCHLLNTFGSLAVVSMLVMGGASPAMARQIPLNGENIPAEGLDVKRDDNLIGGWLIDPEHDTVGTGSVRMDIEGIQASEIIGGSYVRSKQPSETRVTISHDSITTTIGNGDGESGAISAAQFVVGGSKIANGDNYHLKTGAIDLTINRGTFGIAGEQDTPAGKYELVVAGNYIKGAENIGSSSSAHADSVNLNITGGTFHATVVGGSVANVYGATTEGTIVSQSVTDGTTTTVITGGIFNPSSTKLTNEQGAFNLESAVIGGGMAYGVHTQIDHTGSSTVSVSGDTTEVNGKIVAGAVVADGGFGTFTGDSSLTANGGTYNDDLVGGGMVDNEGKGAFDYKKDQTALTVNGNTSVSMTAGTLDGEIMGAAYVRGDGAAVQNGNSSVIVTGGTQVAATDKGQYIIGGGKAMAYGGDSATSTVTGTSHVIISGENTAIYGGAVVGGSLAKATGTGTASATVVESAVDVYGGTLAGVIGGSMAESYSVSEGGSATASVDNTSKVTVRGGEVGNIKFGAVADNDGELAAAVVGGSFANGEGTSANAADTLVAISKGTVTSKVVGGSAAVNGSQVTAGNTQVLVTGGEVQGDLVGGNLIDGSSSTASKDFKAENNSVTSTYVEYSGGSVAGEIIGGSTVRNANAVSTVTGNTNVVVSATVEQSATQSWVEYVVGGGKAMTNAAGDGATANVYGTAKVTITGDANTSVGLVAGGGFTRLQAGGANATARVANTVVNVDSGTLAGVTGGGIAENYGSKTADAGVDESSVTISGDAIINEVKYGAHNESVGTGIAVVGGGIALSTGSGTSKAAVASATTNISGGTVKGDVIASGLADGSNASVAFDADDQQTKSVLNITGGNIKGDVYAGGASVNGGTVGDVDVDAVITGGTIEGSVIAGNYSRSNSTTSATGATNSDVVVELGGTAEVLDGVRVYTDRSQVVIGDTAQVKTAEGTDAVTVKASDAEVILAGNNAIIDGAITAEGSRNTLGFASYTGEFANTFSGFDKLGATEDSVVKIASLSTDTTGNNKALRLIGDGEFVVQDATATDNALTVGDGETSTKLTVTGQLTTNNNTSVSNLSTISVAGTVNEDGAIEVDVDGTTTVDAGGSFEVTGLDGEELTSEELSGLEKKLLSDPSLGLLSLGNVSISGLIQNEYGHYAYDDVLKRVKTDGLQKAIVDVTDEQNAQGISGAFKGVHLTGTGDPTLVATGSLQLSGGNSIDELLVMTGSVEDPGTGHLRIGKTGDTTDTVVTIGREGCGNKGTIGNIRMTDANANLTLNVIGDDSAEFTAQNIYGGTQANKTINVDGATFNTGSISPQTGEAGAQVPYDSIENVNVKNGGAIKAHGVVYADNVTLTQGALEAYNYNGVNGNITIDKELHGQGTVYAENTLTFDNGLTTADGDVLKLEAKNVSTGVLNSMDGEITIDASEKLKTTGGATLNDGDIILAQNWTLATGDNVTANSRSYQQVVQFTKSEQASDDPTSNLDTTYTLNGESLLLHGGGELVNETVLEQLRAELDNHGFKDSPAYLTDQTLNLTSTGKLVVGTDSRVTPTTTDRVVFGDNSVLAIDADVIGDAVFTAADAAPGNTATAYVADSSSLYVENATADSDITIFGTGFGDVAVTADGWTNIQTDTDMLKGTYEDNKAKFEVRDAGAVFPGLSEDLAPAVNDLYKGSLNDVDSEYRGIQFLSRATNNRFLGSDKAAAASTIESAARMAFAGAVPQMTKMASDSATNSVVNRMGFANPENGAKAMNVDGKLVDDKALGLALWIAPLWSNQTGFGMEAGNLDYGYNANIGGISLGADYTWANNFRAGLMFNIGGGYAESSGDLSETTNSMTFWGVGAYGGWKYENFAVMGDVSYTSTWNSVDQDLDHRMGMGDLESDIQASAISAGLRFEYKLETQYLDLIPHVGARYMSINTWGYDVDSADGTILEGDGFQQNIWTFPVGITFSKELEMNNDWYFKPSVDFTVIPAAGDIKAKEDVLFTGMQRSYEVETQMMDYFTWQGGLGLEFGNDNMSVGVNYTLQAGQNSTGHGVFGMFRYEF